MVAEFTKWKFKKGTFFPKNLNHYEENGEKISPFYSFLENGQHKIGFAIFNLGASSSKNSGPNHVTDFGLSHCYILIFA